MPRLILLTDDRRLPDPLPAIARLPTGSGVILRHHDWPERRQLARAVARLCRQRRLILLVANDWRLAAEIGADGVHLAEGLARHGLTASCRLWRRRHGALLSVAAHSALALGQAARLGADFALLSQAFPSRSHPGRPALGPLRFAILARRSRLPIIALGGVNHQSWRRLPKSCARGWAAIDGLCPPK
ncbi:MAG: Thiamine monophosphate [Rhodospirillaceae bacterium]|nr:MAG: Thiamine monophosphate [Rhodospirillaceae bacterium]TNC97509.1 MAG: Thiamine monophosphate synthase [Stygiobacter sp.]